MCRGDRAESLFCRKSQLTLKVREADVFAARDLLLSAANHLDLVWQRPFRRGEEPHGADVPADRLVQGVRPAQSLTFAQPVELGELR
jgi:hypothetical protein